MKLIVFLFAAVLFLSGCSEVQLASHFTKQMLPPSKSVGTFKVGSPYKIDGKRYYPKESYDLVETGIASWYGPQFHGKKTANGETFDKNELTAAHRTLQMPSLVRVTNLENGRSLIVRINDRGPYKRGRIIDLSERAAELLGYKGKGTAKVRLEVLKQESLKIAQAAKSGMDTNGYEVALNRQGVPETQETARQVPVAYTASSSPEAITRETLLAPSSVPESPYKNAVPGHTRNGAFYPDPVVMETPVTKTDIFVQAGSFTVQENAVRLQAQLQKISRTEVYPAMVDGQNFFRVRLGPVESVEEADELLARLVSSGNANAIIIVE